MASELPRGPDFPRGRGRLNSVQLLPPEAEEDVAWAFQALRERKKTQDDILESFNLRLAVKGLGPISRSAFNRASIRSARAAHRLGEVREIAATIATKFEDGVDENVTLLVSETIKTLVFEMLENAGPLKATPMTAEMIANCAAALKSAQQAEKSAADTKKAVNDNFKKKIGETVDKVAQVKGLSAEAKEEFKKLLFGVVDGA